jgi:archaetidylinositol phosphate synthase
MTGAAPPGRNDALPRVNDGWLSAPEERALAWLALRIPGWLSPDRLTALGLVGAIMAFGGYVLARDSPGLLWLVNIGLLVNWFGDSLDGKVARQQAIERPRYGFFLDQSVDVIGQFLFAMGLGFSGYMRLEIAAIGFAVYLMMTVQGLLRTAVTGVFRLAAGAVGLTEIRCMFVVLNVLFYFLPPRPLPIDGMSISYADLLGLAWITANLALYLAVMIAELKRLAREEPTRRSTPPTARDEQGR